MKTIDKLEQKRIELCEKEIARLEAKKAKIREKYPQDIYGTKAWDKCTDVDVEIREIEKYRDQMLVVDKEELESEIAKYKWAVSKMYDRMCKLYDKDEALKIIEKSGVR